MTNSGSRLTGIPTPKDNRAGPLILVSNERKLTRVAVYFDLGDHEVKFRAKQKCPEIIKSIDAIITRHAGDKAKRSVNLLTVYIDDIPIEAGKLIAEEFKEFYDSLEIY